MSRPVLHNALKHPTLVVLGLLGLAMGRGLAGV